MTPADAGSWLLLPVALATGCGLTARTVVERDEGSAGQVATAGRAPSSGGGRVGHDPSAGRGNGGAPVGMGAMAGSDQGGTGGSFVDPNQPCEYLCQPDTCGTPTAAPETLIERPYEQQVVALAVGAEHLYFGTYSNQVDGGQLGRVPLVGGELEILASGVQIAALAVDASNVYFVTHPNTYGSQATTLPLAGGEPHTVTLLERAPGNTLGRVVLRSGWAYFDTHLASTIELASLETGFPQAIVEFDDRLLAFAVDASELFWVTGSTGQTHSYLHRKPAHGGDEAQVLELAEPLVTDMIDEGDSLVVNTGYGDTCSGAVKRLDKQTGELSTLSPGWSGRGAYALAADADGVYWSNGSPQSGVWMRSKSTGATRALALDEDTPAALVTTSARVYWVASVPGSPLRYAIRSVAK